MLFFVDKLLVRIGFLCVFNLPITINSQKNFVSVNFPLVELQLMVCKLKLAVASPLMEVETVCASMRVKAEHTFIPIHR